MNQEQSNQEQDSEYLAADHGCCKSMAKKYGWQLRHSKPSGNKILPRTCVFKGKVQFPKYNDDKPE